MPPVHQFTLQHWDFILSLVTTVAAITGGIFAVAAYFKQCRQLEAAQKQAATAREVLDARIRATSPRFVSALDIRNVMKFIGADGREYHADEVIWCDRPENEAATDHGMREAYPDSPCKRYMLIKNDRPAFNPELPVATILNPVKIFVMDCQVIPVREIVRQVVATPTGGENQSFYLVSVQADTSETFSRRQSLDLLFTFQTTEGHLVARKHNLNLHTALLAQLDD